jgi:hypothetical protein
MKLITTVKTKVQLAIAKIITALWSRVEHKYNAYFLRAKAQAMTHGFF